MTPKPNSEHIHTAGDGRGKRLVTVNGVDQEHCLYADTKRGVAIVAMLPIRLDKHRKRVLTRRLRGLVTVTAKAQTEQS